MTTKMTVLGAGTMGHGIAQVAAQASFSVALYDVNEPALTRARSRIDENLDRAVAKGKCAAHERDQVLARIDLHTDLDRAVQGAELVVEATPESIEVKKQIFAQLSERCAEDTVLATNTSSLSVTEIAQVVRRPERVVGMHFFNPPHILSLLELVRAHQTSDETLARARDFGVRMGRNLVVVNDSPGFATSRLGLVLGLEAIRMLQEGVASAEDIDRAMELGYRHPMGPLRLTDLVGLDVRLAIAEYLHRELGGEQFRPPPLLRRMVRAGKLGKKSGEGFYRYRD